MSTRPSLASNSFFQHNRVNVPAIVRLAPMPHAPIAEKVVHVCVGAGVNVLDRADTGGGESCHNVTGEIEHEMSLAWGRAEEARIGRISGDETVPHVGAGLVIRLPDHRAER